MQTNRKVTLSKRLISKGRKSLFLSYRIGKVRRRENLHIFIEPTNGDQLVRNENLKKMMLAEAIRDKREREILMAESGIEIKSEPVVIPFQDYAKKKLSEIKVRHTFSNYQNTIRKMLVFAPNITIPEINRDFFVKFRDWLQANGLKESSTIIAMQEVKKILNCAVIDGIIPSAPLLKGVFPTAKSAQKVFLTIDEIKALIEAPCGNESLKMGFLFCCFTGLRYCDCLRLRPSDLDGDIISIRMQKTGEIVRIPIGANAKKFLPEVEGNGRFFTFSSNNNAANQCLRNWAQRAGLKKHISFHVSRHTFAVLMLSNDVDIYSVSKLLGHVDLKSTQVYAKLVDEQRKKAVDAIPSI